MACDPNQTCPLCDQQGLPIFPLTYALARAKGVSASRRAPRLQAPFSQDAVALPEDLVHYTLRLVRPGYIYVFNEAREEWSGYIVSESGHLLPFDVQLPAPPAAESAAPCSRMAQLQAGRCIMIPDAHDASLLGKVWLAFTPSAWTQATLERHRSERHRRKHMRCFDAAAWVSGNGASPQPHAARYVQTVPQVAELSPSESLVDTAFPRLHSVVGASPANLMGIATPFMHSLAPAVALDASTVASMGASIRQATQVRPPLLADNLPVAVALDDPSGITADLNALIQGLASEWLAEPERSEKLETAATIDAIKRAIENGAADAAEEDRRNSHIRRDVILRMFAPTTARQLSGPRDHAWSDRVEWAAELSDEERETVGRRRWQRYQKMLKGSDAATQAEWELYLSETFPAEVAQFEAEVLNPLDEAYVAWLQSPKLRDYFRLNFDPGHFSNGIDYAKAFYLLIQEATGRLKVFDFIESELARDPLDEDAIVLRALIGNHAPAIALWTNTDDIPLPTGSEPEWAAAGVKLFSAYVSLVTAASAGTPQGPLNSLGRVAMQLSGPMLKFLGRNWDSLVAGGIRRLPEHRILALLTMLGQTDASPKRVVAINASVTRKQAARTLSSMLAHYSGQQAQVFRSAGRVAYDRLPAAGDPRFNIKGFVFIDENAARSLDHRRGMGVSRSGHLQAVGNAMRPESFDEAMFRAARELPNAEFRGHLLGSVLVALTLGSAWREMEKVGVGANTATANFGGGVAVLTGSMFEGAAALARRTTWGSTSLARPINTVLIDLNTRAAVIGFAGRLVGAVGGAVGGVLAIKEGMEIHKTDKPYGFVMITLGLLGTVAGFLMLFASTLVAGIAFVVGLVVAVLMLLVGFMKPDEVQVWMSKARHFGKHSGTDLEFVSSSDQRSALDQLLAAGLG